MTFKSSLQKIVNDVPGALGALIMGFDGISIDEYVPEASVDVSLLAAEFTAVLKEVKNTVVLLKNGTLEEVVINTGSVTTVARVVNEDFFVILVLTRDGNYGKGRYLARVEAPKIAELL